jgi:hypothetical protein
MTKGDIEKVLTDNGWQLGLGGFYRAGDSMAKVTSTFIESTVTFKRLGQGIAITAEVSLSSEENIKRFKRLAKLGEDFTSYQFHFKGVRQ